jgi:hypothetical protein
MFEKLKETIRGWFADPRVTDIEINFQATRTKTFEEIDRVERSARERMNIISDGIDKNAMFFNEKMRDIVNLRMRIEYLERRLKGDLFHLSANEVAVAKKLGMSIEEYAKNKLALMCNPPAPVKRGRKLGSKNKPKPVPVEVKSVRKARAEKDKGQ